MSCCDARIEAEGVEVGDCEPTRAEVRGGVWWAWLRQERRWIPVPDGKILRERNPGGQDGQLCWTPAGGVLCFVPPDTGGAEVAMSDELCDATQAGCSAGSKRVTDFDVLKAKLLEVLRNLPDDSSVRELREELEQ